MSSAGISFGGLASGLDTQAIIQALVAVERRPISQLETKKTSLNKQKSLYGDLSGLLGKLNSAAKALKTTTDFLTMKAVSDDETVLRASAGSSATPGTYSVRVLKLAQAQVNASPGTASATSSLGAGSAELILDVGGNQWPVSLNDPTPTTIAAAINDLADREDIGVRAEVVDTGNTASGGANRYQLIVRATETGNAGAFSLSFGEGSTQFQTYVNSLGGNRITQGQDAELLLNSGPGGVGGITVFRSSNQISDLWNGITLDLLSVPTPNKDVTITVSTDTEAVGKKMTDFVDAYNKVVDFFTSQSALDSEGKAQSPLFGDQTLRSMRSTLRTTLGASVDDSGNLAYQLLSQVGISSDTAGKLTFNKAKFDAALADDEQAVAAFFTNAERLTGQIDVYTDSVDGLIKSRSETFDRQVKQTQSRIDQSERRLTQYQKQLEAKYANLESLLTRLQGQGSSVSRINSFRR
jgi:flagellar hook-associated protein 2